MPEAEAADKTVPRKRVAVVMQRRAIDNRWQSEVWEPLGVLADYEGPDGARVLVEAEGIKQWLFPGFDILLRPSEAEGYYHNVSSAEPCVFILWRIKGTGARPNGFPPEPQFVTVRC